MEFFICRCPHAANVILDHDGIAGPANTPLLCNEGYHHFSLECLAGKSGADKCSDQEMEVAGTDPIFPLEVVFQCGR